MMCQSVENAPWTQLGTSAAMAMSLCHEGELQKCCVDQGDQKKKNHFFSQIKGSPHAKTQFNHSPRGNSVGTCISGSWEETVP